MCVLQPGCLIFSQGRRCPHLVMGEMEGREAAKATQLKCQLKYQPLTLWLVVPSGGTWRATGHTKRWADD